MGFVGASPFHNVFANWAGALVGVAAVYVWTRWLGHATSCDVAAGSPRDELTVLDDVRTSHEPFELRDDAFAAEVDARRPQ